MIKDIKSRHIIQYFKILFLFFVFILLMFFKRLLFPSQIIFYEGLIVCFLYFTFILWFKILTFDKSIILFLICVNFWSLVPTILDRSVSITILGNLKVDQSKTIVEIKEDFNEIYLVKNNSVKKRIDEQIASGNIIENNDGYQLTQRGNFNKKVLIFLTRFFRINESYITRG